MGRSIGEAITAAHFPDDFEQRDAAVRRLAHDELLALQVGMVQRRRQRREERRSVISVEDAVDAALREAIGAGLVRRVGRAVSLTVDQAAAMAAIRGDLAGSVPMLRLIQGDVGSGKTAVAAYALALAARAGGQGALLAPTDLLARQLAETIDDLLRDADLPVTLLTGSLSGAWSPIGPGGHRGGAGPGRGRHARAAAGCGLVCPSRPGRRRRAAPLRRRPARGAGGQG